MANSPTAFRATRLDFCQETLLLPTSILVLPLKELTGGHLVTTGQSRGGSLRVSPHAECYTVLQGQTVKSQRELESRSRSATL